LVYPLARRDIEFLWSDTYASTYSKPLAQDSVSTDLDRMGATFCRVYSNPLGLEWSDIKVVYSFLNKKFEGSTPITYRDSIYITDLEYPGFKVAQVAYPNAERAHLDLYVYVPKSSTTPGAPYYCPDSMQSAGDDTTNYGMFDSNFEWESEDSLTVDSAMYHRNSVMITGPTRCQVGDTSSTGWGWPDGLANSMLQHEFQHCINNDPGNTLNEIFSLAADALAGTGGVEPEWDVPYTFSLLNDGRNDQNWDLFARYICYNYPGVGGTPSNSLMWRWAHGQNRTLVGLAQRLADGECAECQAKGYFAGLNTHDRLQVLLHNWRVATYVNNDTLSEAKFEFRTF
jgi:hypothetical protein